MPDLTIKTAKKVGKKLMTRGEWITMLIGFLFFISIMLSVLYSLYAAKKQVQLERESEEQRLNNFDVDFAIAVAEKINANEAFGQSRSIHPQQLVSFRVRELEAIAAGIDKRDREDQYFRITINGYLPDYDTEIEKWDPPFFMINSRLVYVRTQLNCANTSRSISFPRHWTLRNPDIVLVRVRRKADSVLKNEEDLAQLLETTSERIKSLEVWKKTCKWTVSPPSTQ